MLKLSTLASWGFSARALRQFQKIPCTDVFLVPYSVIGHCSSPKLIFVIFFTLFHFCLFTDNGEGSITRGCGSNSNGSMIGAEITRADHGQYSEQRNARLQSSCSTDLCNWDVAYKQRIRRQIKGMFKFPLSVRPGKFSYE